MSEAALARATMARVDRHVLPLLLAAYLVNFLDRVNIGFASLQMNAALGFGPEVYGFGAGVFFLGYFLFEVPSNWALSRVGARRWLARIMVTWGIVSAATALVRTPAAFVALRFLLGVAEAGIVPALLVHLAAWYPADRRAAAVATVWNATALALIVGAPLSALLLSLDGVLGVSGWQWMFVLEALPALLLGIVVWRRLADRPDQTAWLDPEQRRWLAARIDGEAAIAKAEGQAHRFADAFADPRVWALGSLYFCLGLGFFGVTLWLPQLVREVTGTSAVGASVATALPFVAAAAAAAAMVATARYADRHGGHHGYVVGGALVAATGFGIAATAMVPPVVLGGLTLGAVGLWSVIGVFWQLPTAFLTGPAAAAGVAIVNALGSLGGFAGPYAIGLLRARNGGFGAALLLVAGAMLAAAAIAWTFGRVTPSRPALPAIS